MSLINYAMISILTTCYQNQSTAVLWNLSDRDVIQSVWIAPLMAMLLFNSPTLTSHYSENLDKQKLLITSIKSHEEYPDTLLKLKESRVWYVMTSFWILDRSNNSCKHAEFILKSSWRMNILTCFVICENHEANLIIFTYNPFTKRAPESWKEARQTMTLGIDQEERWTLFYQQFEFTQDFCHSLHFDRAKFLDHYKINISLSTFTQNSSFIRLGYHLIDPSPRDYWYTYIPEGLKSVMNCTFNIDCYEYDFQNIYYVYHGLDDKYEFTIAASPIQSINKYLRTYPAEVLPLAITMQKRGYYTPIEKIVNYYGNFMSIALVIISAITSLVIYKSQRHKTVAFATFEILRLLTNGALLSDLKAQYLRIFFFTIFLYFLIMQTTFSGNISSFLTKQELRKMPERLKDLTASYVKTLYMPEAISFDVSNPVLRQKWVLLDHFDCSVAVKDDPSAACISVKADLIQSAVVYRNLWVSRKSFAVNYFSYITRYDWPLLDRLDLGIIRMHDSGLTHLWTRRYYEIDEESMAREDAKGRKNYRPVSLIDINFAFIILVIGLTMAIACFLMENTIGHSKINNTHVDNQIRKKRKRSKKKKQRFKILIMTK